MKVTVEQARNIFLNKQLLGNSKLPKGKTGVLRAVEKLGYVQIDTINVIERSHHIVLFTRCPDYEHSYLHELQTKDRKIFEYWAHEASFIPMRDYRFYLSVMGRIPKKDSGLAKWIEKNRHLMRKVKARVDKEGPLSASDFGDVKNRKRGTWWDWKPAKMALEVLFWQGHLMVKERRKFQRIYDITERVLPKEVNTAQPTVEEEKRFFIRRALGAMGIATVQDTNRYIGVSGKLNKWIDHAQKSEEIVKVEIEGLKTPYYIFASDLEECECTKTKVDTKVRLLSPFDNAIILRNRTRALFGFNYSLECYVPKNKRKYGYFCLPILWQNQIVGRMDAKADREKRTLIINNLHLEDKKLDFKTFIPALSQCLKDFARFHKCEDIELSKNIPARIRRLISNI